jgi:hypothetical protein
MNKGFSIDIQSGLTPEEDEVARTYAEEFTMNALYDDFKYPYRTRGGHSSYLRRGTFGNMIDDEKRLVFRRISRRLRKFAIVKADTMVDNEGNEVVMKQCRCPKHRGGTRVIWRDQQKPNMYNHIKVGKIKG